MRQKYTIMPPKNKTNDGNNMAYFDAKKKLQQLLNNIFITKLTLKSDVFKFPVP